MPKSRFGVPTAFASRRLTRLVAALVVTVTLVALGARPGAVRSGLAQESQPADQPSVAMFRGDSMRTGVQPGPAPVGDPVVRWTFQTGGAVRSSPAVAGGAVYVGSKDGYLYAIDAATGAERWRFATGGEIVASPAVADGTVYFGSQDGYFYALDAATGERRWYLHLWATGSPSISGDTIFLTTNSNTLHALDTRTGLERWHVAFAFTVTEPAVAGQTVFVGADGLIQAFDKNDGRSRWVYDVDGDASASPVVALGRVYLAVTASDDLEDEITVDEDATTNEEDAPPGANENMDAGGGGAASLDTRLYAVDTESGTLRWSLVIPSDRAPASAMALVDGVLYAGSSRGWLYAIDPNSGKQLWGYQTNGAVIASPVVAGGEIFIGSYAGGFHVLDAVTGAVKWVHEMGAPIVSSAAVVDSVVYVGNDAGTLVAIAGSGAPAEPAAEG